MRFSQKAFRDLDERFRYNESRDPLVSAFNLLPADERAVVLAYIVLGENKQSLARLLGVSVPVVYDRLWRIQVMVQDIFDRHRKADEEAGYINFFKM